MTREHSQARNMGDVVEVEETIPKRQTFKVVVGTGTEEAIYFCFGDGVEVVLLFLYCFLKQDFTKPRQASNLLCS